MNYAKDENDYEKFDEVITEKNVRVIVDSKALMFLIGTEMDFVEDEIRSEFVFNNPNSKGECGCGESFTVWMKTMNFIIKLYNYHYNLIINFNQSLFIKIIFLIFFRLVAVARNTSFSFD